MGRDAAPAAAAARYRHRVTTQDPRRWKLPLRKATQTPAPPAYRWLLRILRPLIGLLTRRRWLDADKVPRTGGVLVVANHLGNYDTIAIGEYLIYHGRWPRYLGKEEIWKVPVVGWFATQCRQIPVRRNTPHAKDALVHAKRALFDGDLVAMYPEGTITRDPDGWPMTGRTGAARLALETGVPVVPVVVHGTDAVLGGRYLRLPRPWRGRATVTVRAGDPIDLSRFTTTAEPDKETLEAVVAKIMDTLTGMVEEIRGQKAPALRWDMRQGKRVGQRSSGQEAIRPGNGPAECPGRNHA